MKENIEKEPIELDVNAMDKLQELQNQKPKKPETMKAVGQQLKEIAINKRETAKEHNDKLMQAYLQAKDEHKQVAKPELEKETITGRDIADLLEKHLTTAVIGNNSKDIEKAPLVFYDLDTGLYTMSSRTIDKLILMINEHITGRPRREIREWLRLDAPVKHITEENTLVPVGNGIYNKTTNELMPFSPKYVFTGKVATDYIKENIQEPIFDGWKFTKWLDELADGEKDKYHLLWQMIASVVQNRKTTNVLFCLIDNGQGRTGKSTFEQLLMNLVGKDNYSALKLAEFDEQFLLAQAYGSSLIIGDDNNPKAYIDNGSTLKSIVTNELVLINPKGQPPFSTRFYCTIVQSMNGFPRFKDTSGGLYRRFRLIKFNHQYPDTAAGHKVKDEYIHDQRLLQWILKKALTINIDTIINTKESQTAVTELQLENDPVLSFVQEVVPNLKSRRFSTGFLFALFRKYSKDSNNITRMTLNTFTRRVRPLMIERGWEYTKSRPGKYLAQEDIDRLKPIGDLYDYNRYKQDANESQNCFIKE